MQPSGLGMSQWFGFMSGAKNWLVSHRLQETVKAFIWVLFFHRKLLSCSISIYQLFKLAEPEIMLAKGLKPLGICFINDINRSDGSYERAMPQ
jgi:hypothetical protein